jgi:hypothetical protein
VKVTVKAKNEDGDIILEGVIAKEELSFLVQYAINDLMAVGMEFMLGEEDGDGDKQLKFNYGEGKLN